jgi:protein tyrosine phosphatase (PTP) superfamily phosphohydrolase (DUF442 family)
MSFELKHGRAARATWSAMTFPPKPANSTALRLVALLVFLLLVAVGSIFAWQHFTGVYHLATVQAGVLYRDGARSEPEMERAVAKVHPKTVVCLVDEQEVNDPNKPQFKEEFSFLDRQGIRMERIPVKLGGWPSSDDVQKFLTIAAEPKNQPVLVHCAQGVRRTAMMVAAFQESILGYDKERAKAEILTFGHSESTVNDIRRFINGYDPKTRTVAMEDSK